MFLSREVLRSTVAMTVNNTYKLDLPEHGLLTSLIIRISGAQMTGYGQAVENWRLIDELSKVTVLANASEVIKSLTCKQAQALAFFDQGVNPPSQWRMYATNTQFETMLINFGRKFGDTDFGLDLSTFNNVEVQLSNIATAADFSALAVTIEAVILREAPASQYVGYFRTEEWKRWTTVSDETIYNILPTQYPLRRIILQAIPDKDANFQNETSMYNVMDNVELSLDSGQVRVYNDGLDQLMFENYMDQGRPFMIGAQTYNTADYGTDISIGRLLGIATAASTKDGAVAASIPTLKADEGNGTISAEVYGGDEPVQVLAFGMSPYYCAYFDFGLNGDPSNYLDPDARKSVKLDIHTRSGASYADGTAAIVLDRLVRR